MSHKVLSIEEKENFTKKAISTLIAIFAGGITYAIWRSISNAFLVAIGLLIVINIYLYFREKLIISSKIRKMEAVFPDFIELVSSNLRAGMNLDKALLVSSRKEFDPLDKQILLLGKDILTGKNISHALEEMAKRTGSEKIQKTVELIVSGLKSGGNVAVLLEETAVNIRERTFVEKRAASNVLMYIILIAFAITIGAPTLFALSTVLVSVMTGIMADIPQTETSLNLPFALKEVGISVNFITIYAVIFLVVIGILSSLLLGLVNRGDQKEGLKYAPFFIAISVVIFFIMKTVLLKSFSGVFG